MPNNMGFINSYINGYHITLPKKTMYTYPAAPLFDIFLSLILLFCPFIIAVY